MKYDFIIIGAGIVGASTAWQLARRCSHSRILLLEKEILPARHQSGHNSGVIHAGVYYEPGSLKARFCREGAEATYAFCKRHRIPCAQTGKLLVAVNSRELEGMHRLYDRCRENGLSPRKLDSAELGRLEPNVRGAGAILVEKSGIVSFPAVCGAMLEQFRAAGGETRLGAEVSGISEHGGEIRVQCGDETLRSGKLVVCAGLMADRLARMQGLDIDFRIIPYRGEYYRLRAGMKRLVRRLVYPIPDPELPFLGVHLTPTIEGDLTVGPNAVQAWKREGYGRLNFDLHDTASVLSWPGFWRATARHFRHGLGETWNSLWKPAFTARVRRYCPEIRSRDLLPHPAGVRAQAVKSDGEMIHDFLIEQTARSLHVCNAPSPAATSAIPIGRHICDILLDGEPHK